MIRAFVALSLIVLALLVYAIRGGLLVTPTSSTSKVITQNTSTEKTALVASSSSSLSSVEAKPAPKVVAKKRTTDELGLGKAEQEAKASANVSALERELPKTDREIPAHDLVSRQDTIRKETQQAIEKARREALEKTEQQINAKLAEVQTEANDKIVRIEKLLEESQRAKAALSAENEELEQIQKDAQLAAEEALAAAKKAAAAMEKTTVLLGAKKVAITEKINRIEKLEAPLQKAEIIRSVEDAKKQVKEPKTEGAVRARISDGALTAKKQEVAKSRKPVSSVAAKATNSDVKNVPLPKDPVTGLPATHGYSVFADDKATIFFSFASTHITESAIAALQKAFERFGKSPSADYLVVGFSDGVGNEEAKQKISQARTAAVKDYFVKLGVPEQKIKTQSQPMVTKFDNNTALGRMMNRRVEVSVQ